MEVYQAVEETLRFLFETKFTSLVQELIVQGLFELATTRFQGTSEIVDWV